MCFDQLNQYMPARTIGYPWTLIYSTEQHGFSLKTLYRHMQGVDSPVMLVVKDTNNNVSITTAVDKSFTGEVIYKSSALSFVKSSVLSSVKL